MRLRLSMGRLGAHPGLPPLGKEQKNLSLPSSIKPKRQTDLHACPGLSPRQEGDNTGVPNSANIEQKTHQPDQASPPWENRREKICPVLLCLTRRNDQHIRLELSAKGMEKKTGASTVTLRLSRRKPTCPPVAVCHGHRGENTGLPSTSETVPVDELIPRSFEQESVLLLTTQNELNQAVLESSPYQWRWGRADSLIKQTITKAQKQGY